MQKVDSLTRSLVEKIAKTYHDMKKEGSDAKLTVDGKSMKEYLCEFHWDSERFPEKNAIGEHKNLIQQVRSSGND